MQSSPPETNPAEHPSRPPVAGPITQEDRDYVDALKQAGLVPDLAGDELARVARLADGKKGLDRRAALLEAYYAAGGDGSVSSTRRTVDRFLLQREGDPLNTSILLSHLSELAPELGEIVLERIGGGDEGPLVLRSGENFAALLDDYEENLDTGELDLREIEARDPKVMAVTVRGLVRAVNALLERIGVRERFVQLASDHAREVYVAVPLTEALELARAGHLEDDNAEAVMEHGCW
jgi:hypothetical protein